MYKDPDPFLHSVSKCLVTVVLLLVCLLNAAAVSSAESDAAGSDTYCNNVTCGEGEGDCDSDSECEDGLTCVHDVGENYGFRSIVDVCEAPAAGSDTYCTTALCGIGEGDCDSDSECQSGLICSMDVGGSYGFRDIVDVCVEDGGSVEAPGSNDYCQRVLCGAGEGDCDSDSECQSGLVCATDVGATYGFRDIVDVCVEDAGSGEPAGGDSYCQSTLCGAGEGDCDSDSECQPGLVCATDVGATYGFRDIVDVCVEDEGTGEPLGGDSYCQSTLCGAGEGDCDSDNECQSGLICATDVGTTYGFRSIVDVCVEQDDSDSDNDSSGSQNLTYTIVDTNQTDCYSSSTGLVSDCSGEGQDGDYSGNQPDYTVSSDGLTVTDNVTGLIWQQSSDITDDGTVDYDDKLYQSDAVTYCDDLVLAGRDDWRLPDIKQAYSLILFSGKDASSYQGTDTSTLVPFLDSAFDWTFGDLDSGNDRIIDAQYASTSLYVSTTMNGDPTMFGVNYVDGRIKGYPTHIKKFYVRCVTGTTDYGVNDFVDNGDQTVSDNATGLMWQKDDAESTNWVDAVSVCESAATASYSDWRLPNAKELQSLVDYTVSPDTHNQAAINSIFNATSFENEEGETDWGYYWSSTTHVDNDGNGSNAAYVSFGRALGYMNGNVLDVHGAGSQRSDDKVDVASEPGAQSATGVNGTFYYKGPQGDILRNDSKIRCVRDQAVD